MKIGLIAVVLVATASVISCLIVKPLLLNNKHLLLVVIIPALFIAPAGWISVYLGDVITEHTVKDNTYLVNHSSTYQLAKLANVVEGNERPVWVEQDSKNYYVSVYQDKEISAYKLAKDKTTLVNSNKLDLTIKQSQKICKLTDKQVTINNILVGKRNDIKTGSTPKTDLRYTHFILRVPAKYIY